MITIIVIGLAVVVLAILGLAATKPSVMRIERSARIDAAPGRVFPLINDLRKWQVWSPWERLDPAMQRAYGGAEAGPGAFYEWEGNKKAGKGRMQIAESTAPSRVTIDLHFIQPFENRGRVDFLLRDTTGGTDVTWAMESPSSFMTKVMCVFVNMDRLVGRDFEAGLARLKEVAEAADQSPANRSSTR